MKTPALLPPLRSAWFLLLTAAAIATPAAIAAAPAPAAKPDHSKVPGVVIAHSELRLSLD
ncbi:MAG: hypothetical protein HZC55_04620 [Verrucomicrobia bacterium]|nr:hypothetical protein [Verrucomicrobiota bacterium]